MPWKQQLKGEARTGLREKKLCWAWSHRQLLSSTLNVSVEGQLPPVGTPGGQMGQFSFSLLIHEWTSRDKYKQTRTVASALLIVSEAGTGHNGGAGRPRCPSSLAHFFCRLMLSVAHIMLPWARHLDDVEL